MAQRSGRCPVPMRTVAVWICRLIVLNSSTIDRDDSSLQPRIQIYHDAHSKPCSFWYVPLHLLGSASSWTPLVSNTALRIDIVGIFGTATPNRRFMLLTCFPITLFCWVPGLRQPVPQERWPQVRPRTNPSETANPTLRPTPTFHYYLYTPAVNK